MNDRDKKLLISEINKWRQSKILPSAYCDFLLNLYSAGGNDANSSVQADQSKDKKSSFKKGFFYLLAAVLIGLIGFIVMSFTALTPFTQITILVAVAVSIYISTIIYKKKGSNPIILLMLHSFASVSLAVGATYGIMILELRDQPMTLQIVFLCVFAIWLVMGLWLQHLMVFIASLAGITVIVNQFVVISALQHGLLYAQLYWLPLAFITLWLSYAINQQTKYYKQSIILLVTSIVFLFMPEIGLMIYGETLERLAIILPIKAVMLGVLIYLANKTIFRVNSIKHVED